MRNDTVRIGIIGAGFISNYHINGLKGVKGAQIVVVADTKPARAVERAAGHGIPETLGDYRALLERRDIDAVVIATPDHTHEEVAIAAADAGKAILLQKPMAMSVAGCRTILERARANKVNLQVSWMHRYFEEVVRARELLADGRLGAVYAVRIRNAVSPAVDKPWYYQKAFVAGGAVLQLGVHGIDLAQHMFGAISSLQATTDILMPKRTMPDGEVIDQEVEDHALVHYKFACGALGTHEMTSCEAQGTDRFSMEIYCEKGTILLRTIRGALALWAPGITGHQEWSVPPLPEQAFGVRQHAWWIDVLQGRVTAATTAEDAINTQIIADTIYRSAQTGTRQDVAPYMG